MRLFSVALGFLFIFLSLLLFLIPLKEETPIEQEIKDIELPHVKSNQQLKKFDMVLKDGFFQYIKVPSEEIVSSFGEPDRKDLTPYGYMLWVYSNPDAYLLFGVEDDVVQTIFATGNNVLSKPFTIGESFDVIKQQFPLQSKLTYQKGISHYSFMLYDEDLQLQPLIQLSEDVFLQCYIDSFTNEISSLRLITGDLLIKQRFYEMEYRGNLPEAASLSDSEWEQVDAGMEKQIYELTNIYREMMDLSPLRYDSKVSEVAFNHSKDMYEQNYFSHDSKDGRGLKERMAELHISYLSAGENIAAQHLDAPAVMHGWLNSEGHRETLLSEQYNYIGVGVFKQYYTQNFILNP